MPSIFLGEGGIRYGWQTDANTEQTTFDRYLAATTAFAPTSNIAQIDRNVAFGSQYTRRRRPGTSNVTGSDGYPLYPQMGFELGPYGVMGKYSTVAALTDDTNSATVTTTGGISTVVLTAGSATIRKGMGGIFASGTANEEPFQVLTYNAGTKTLTTKFAKAANLTATAGKTVKFGLNHRMVPQKLGDGTTDRPWLTREDWHGNAAGSGYTFRRPGVSVSSFTVAGDADAVDVTTAWVPRKSGRKITSPAAWSPPAADSNDQSRFFTVLHGGLLVGADMAASGTSSLQFVEVNSFSIALERAVRGQSRFKNINGIITDTQIENQTLGLGSTISFMVDNTTGRNAFEEDYVLPGNTTSFYVFLAQANPAGGYDMWSFVAEQFTYLSSTSGGGPGDIETLAVTGEAAPVASTLDQCAVYVVNSASALTLP